jgi:hypothetical protein
MNQALNPTYLDLAAFIVHATEQLKKDHKI